MSEAAPQATVFLPPPPDRYDRAWVARLLESLRQNLDRRLSRETANRDILLQSPSGKVFRVSVADDGVLTSTYVNG